MSPEDRMRDSDAVLAELHADNVLRIKAAAEQCSPAEMNKLVAGAGLASRRVSSALKESRAGQAAAAKAAASALKALAANENDIDASLEIEMDDDSGRTPERLEAVRAEIRRRLALVGGDRESKSLDGAGPLAGGAGRTEDVARDGGAPEASR